MGYGKGLTNKQTVLIKDKKHMDTNIQILFPKIKKTTCGQAVCGCWEGHNLSYCMADPLGAISEDEDGTMFENMPGT